MTINHFSIMPRFRRTLAGYLAASALFSGFRVPSIHAGTSSLETFAAASPEGASLASAYERARHGVLEVEGAPGHFRAQNPGNGLNARFTPEGLSMTVTLADPDGGDRKLSTRWRTVAYGYGDKLAAVPAGIVRYASPDGPWNRVEIIRPGLVEWFVNGKQGLEHGWTLSERPGGWEGATPLRIELALEGDLLAQVTSEGDEVVLRDGDGEEALRYRKLKVIDAAGREMEARMGGGGKSLAVEVEDAGAIYPLTIDPTFVQQTYLKASNTAAGDWFGRSVAISGNTAIVGAPFEADGPSNVSGAAYVFVRNGTTWSQQAYLKASNAEHGDWFGWNVAIDGNTAVVSALYEDGASTGVGGNQSSNGAADSGAAYVFVRNGTTWIQQAYLKASNTETGDEFGSAVAIDGNTVVVGANKEDGSSSGVNQNQGSNGLSASGACYVFVRGGSVWTQQAYLKASNTGAGDEFGISAAVSGDTLVVGAYLEDSGDPDNQNDSSAESAGAAYVFKRTGAVWAQQLYLKAPNAGAYDGFGFSVGVGGEAIVVGAPTEDGPALGSSNAPDVANSGAAYIFVRRGTDWTPQAYLKAPNAGVEDQFGGVVAISGEIVIVGASGESSVATGIDGNQSSDGASRSGAAYVFVRYDSTWYWNAYLKASNTGTQDLFGYSVAIDGNTAIVGAVQEDSAASGVGANQTDNSAESAGAAYVFLVVPFPEGFMTIPKRFSSTTTGKQSRPQTVRIVNNGPSPFSNLRVSTSGRAKKDFAITQPALRTVAPGGSTTYRVTFKPRAKGSRRANLELRGTDLVITAPVSGTGKAR